MPDTLASMVRAKHPGAYDDLTDAQLEQAVVAKFPGVYDDLVRTAAPAEPPTSAVGRFGRELWDTVNPVSAVKGLATAVLNPIDTVVAIGRAQIFEGRKAVELARSGRYVEAAGHGAAALLPVIGPAAAAAGEQIGEGDVAGGLGRGVGLIGTTLIPAGVRGVRKALPARAPKAAAPLTKADQSVAFAQRNKIPMSAGVATDNPVVRGLEQLNEHTSIGGSLIARNRRQAQGAAMTRVGGDIADQVFPTHVVPEQAGQSLRASLGSRAATQSAAADAAYDALRALEAKQAGRISAVGGVQAPATSSQAFTNVPLAVDIVPTQRAMQPVLAALEAEHAIVPFVGGSQKGKALVALTRLSQAPAMAPLSIADSALGELKTLARVDETFRRTIGQGIAADAVSNLEKAVTAAAKRGGPNVFNALTSGRVATVKKYQAIAALDKLAEEPVRAFNSVTFAKDAGVGTLRQIAAIAPDQMPVLGRAYLDDLLTLSEGSFPKAAKKWADLGPQTKRLLLKDPSRIESLDHFFEFGARAAKNANPSGSAFVGTLGAKGMFTVMNPMTGIPLELGQTALSSALWNPSLTRLLTRSLTTPTRATGSAGRLSAEIADALRQGGLLSTTNPSGRQPATTAEGMP